MKPIPRYYLLAAFMVSIILSGVCPPWQRASADTLQQDHAFPGTIDPSGKYLIFLHNYYVETKGPDKDCRYNDILEAFASRGLNVISEIRTGRIIPCTYGQKVVSQVNRLMAAGVPPGAIVVAGHSKGAVIALCAAAGLNHPDIRFVILAGCGIKGLEKHGLYPDFKGMKGKMLSLYAGSDKVAGSCKPGVSQAGQALNFTEIRLESPEGHRLFFAPKEIWTGPVMDWIQKN